MAKRNSIASKELQLVIVGPRDSFKATRVQRLSLNTDIPTTTVYELGNSSSVGDAKDVPNVTLSFSAFDVGVKIFSALTGTDPDNFPSEGVGVSSLGEMDAIIYIKSATASDYVKTIHARKLQIRDFSYSYSLDGEATEDYTAVGSDKRLFAYDIIVDKFTEGTTSFTLTQTPIQLSNGNYARSVILDGEYLLEVADTPGTGEYSVSGTTLTTGDSRTAQCLVVYHANPAGSNWTDVGDTSLASAVRGKDINIVLAGSDLLRVQSVTINGNLNPTAVREMGNKQGIAGYTRQVPTIEGTLTVLDTDTELANLLINGATTTSGVVEWGVGEGCVASGVSLEIQIEDPCDTTSPYTVLKTIYLDSISPTGDAYSVNVNQDLQYTIPFKSTTSTLTVYSGAKS
jgi:hypothetical protein